MNATSTLAINYAWISYNNKYRRINKKFNREDFAACLAHAYWVIKRYGDHVPSYTRHAMENAIKRMQRKWGKS